MYNLRVLNTTMSISIRKVNVHQVQCPEIPRIVDWLMENYFPNVFLYNLLNITEQKAVEFLRNFCTETLHQNVSMVGITPEGDIAAVACNMVLRKDQKLDFDAHPDMKKIGDFATTIFKESGMFENYPEVEEYMYVAFLFVHEDYKKQGLAKRLVESTRELASKLGLKVMRTDSYGSEAARQAEKTGWTLLKEVEYVDYKINDEQVFHPDESNTTFGIYTMKTEHESFLHNIQH